MTTKNPQQERVPQAPRTPLPELAEFLAPVRGHFTPGPRAETLRQYLTGVRSAHPNKNCDTWAEIVPETKEPQCNHLLTDRVWAENSLKRQRIARMRILPSAGEGVLSFAETGVEQQGRQSVGVAPQDTGTAGKLTPCQGTVNCQYAERRRAWPGATRLYLPPTWAADAARRTQAQVPADVPLQTKAELALALLEEATAGGVGHACVTGAADYGDNPNCLTGLAARRERYVVAVRANCSVTLGRGHTSPVLRAAEVLAAPLQDWQTLAWSEGAKGWWRAKVLARRGGRVDGQGTRPVGGLLGHRPGRGQTGEGKYFWSEFPADPPLAVLVESAQRRHGVEQYQEEAKTELGWAQSQGRRWDGFQRPALTVRLSYSFRVWLEGREREHRKVSGRRAPLFPPRPDRRRVPLPEVHRWVSEWLRCTAIRELIELGLIDWYCSRNL